MIHPSRFALLAVLCTSNVAQGDALRGSKTVERELGLMTGMARQKKPGQKSTEEYLFEIIFKEGADPPADVLCLEKTIKNNMAAIAKQYLVDELGYHPSVVWGEVLELNYIEQAKDDEKAMAEQEFDAVKVISELTLEASLKQFEEERLTAEIAADQKRLGAVEKATEELKKQEDAIQKELGDTQKNLDEALETFNDTKQKANAEYSRVVRPAKENENKKNKEAEATRDKAIATAEAKYNKNTRKTKRFEKAKELAERECEETKERFKQEFLNIEIPARHKLLEQLKEPTEVLKDLEQSLLDQTENLKDRMKTAEDAFEKEKMRADEQCKKDMDEAKAAESRKKDKAKEREEQAVEQAREKKIHLIEVARDKASGLKEKYHARKDAQHYRNLEGSDAAVEPWSASFVVSVICKDDHPGEPRGKPDFCAPERSLYEESVEFQDWMKKGIEEALNDNCADAKKLDQVNFIFGG